MYRDSEKCLALFLPVVVHSNGLCFVMMGFYLFLGFRIYIYYVEIAENVGHIWSELRAI